MAKRTQILQAAILVFKEKGIEKTKISDIVKEAGVAQGTYYLYFPSKLAIMPAIAEVMIEKVINEVENSVSKRVSFNLQLGQIVDAVFKITKEYHEVIALVYAGLASTKHIKEWELIYEPFYMWMTNFLDVNQKNGRIKESYNINYTAKLIIGLIESAAEQVYLYDTANEDQVKRQKEEVLYFLITALSNIK